MAFLCHFYGGRPADWLALPIRTFFAMAREGKRMEARHYAELCDISLIADNMKIEYYVALRSRYERMIDGKVPQLPERPGGVVLEAGSDDARKLLRATARNLRKNLGYGG